MRRVEKNGLQWLEFDQLADIKGLRHGVFLRHGGHSTGNFDSLNLSTRIGDEPASVSRNLHKVQEALQAQNLVWAEQCHGKHVHHIKEQAHKIYSEGDALTTALPGVGLVVHHADCQAAIFYDPMRRAIANAHSGWRGSVQNIYGEVIRSMQETYGSNPADLLVCISPSLGPQSAQFINYKTELPEKFWEFQHKPLYFDFWEISKMQLKQCGVLGHHIEVASICTYTNPQDYFSYRFNKNCGRNGTVICLR